MLAQNRFILTFLTTTLFNLSAITCAITTNVWASSASKQYIDPKWRDQIKENEPKFPAECEQKNISRMVESSTSRFAPTIEQATVVANRLRETIEADNNWQKQYSEKIDLLRHLHTNIWSNEEYKRRSPLVLLQIQNLIKEQKAMLREMIGRAGLVEKSEASGRSNIAIPLSSRAIEIHLAGEDSKVVSVDFTPLTGVVLQYNFASDEQALIPLYRELGAYPDHVYYMYRKDSNGNIRQDLISASYVKLDLKLDQSSKKKEITIPNAIIELFGVSEFCKEYSTKQN